MPSDLFGDRPEKTVSPARQLVLDYRRMFMTAFGFEPRIVWARDVRNIGSLVQLWGEPETRRLIGVLLTTQNRRVQNSDRSLKLLFDMAQQLKLETTEVRPVDRRTADNIAAAERALGVTLPKGRW